MSLSEPIKIHLEIRRRMYGKVYWSIRDNEDMRIIHSGADEFDSFSDALAAAELWLSDHEGEFEPV